MGWREDIVKAILAKGGRTDLVTPGFHGTTRTFGGFKNHPMAESYMIDRSPGSHVAADPALASSFPDRIIKGAEQAGREPGGAPQVLPVMIPAENKFLQAVQPERAGRANEPQWSRVATDQNAIERMVARKGYPQNPEILERYLMEARALPAREAIDKTKALMRGDVERFDNVPMNFNEFIGNYGGRPYNVADQQAVVDLAREAWEKEGHKGIKYINTAPMEAGAPGVTDPTSYIVFRPENIRSRFAKFDPANASSSDLLGSVAALAAVPPTLGAFTRQDDYNGVR